MWITETFKTKKSIIPMRYFDTLPGAPYHNQHTDIKAIIKRASNAHMSAKYLPAIMARRIMTTLGQER